MVAVNGQSPVKPGIYVFRQDEIGDFVSGRLDATSSPSSGTTPGVRGLVMSDRVQDEVRVALAKRDGFYGAVVQKPAIDAWSGGWEPVTTSEDLKAEIMRFDAMVRVWPGHRGVKEGARRCHALARRDGRSLMFVRLKDASRGDSAKEPSGVVDILELQPLPRRQIKSIVLDTNLASDRFGKPQTFEVYRKARDETSVVRIHWERAFLFIPRPNDDSPHELDGDSELDALMVGAEALANVKFALSAAYYNFGSPYLVAVVDKEFDGSEDAEEMQCLDEDLEQLKTGAQEKIRLWGADIKLLHAEPSDPAPFVKVHREDAAAWTGIPLRELTGSDAGALQAAEWDSRRYDQSVVTPNREGFGTSFLLDWYARLQKWGLLKSPGNVEGIIWYPYIQADEKGKALLFNHLANAINGFARVKMPIPKEIQAFLTIPEESGFDPNQPLELVQAPGPSGFGAPAPEDRALGQDNENVPPELTRLEERVERAVRRALAMWRKSVNEALRAAGHQGVRADAAEDAAAAREMERVILSVHFNGMNLGAILEALALEAAQLGMARQARLSRGRVFEFLDRPEAQVLRQHARELAEAKAIAATRAVRETIATSIAKGEGVSGVRRALAETFAWLENAATITRTEVMHAYNQGSFAGMREAGVQEWTWRAYPGADEECAELDGQVFPIDSATQPPLHPNCRCIPQPVLWRTPA